MMTGDISRRPPNTFADLKDRNYTLHILDDHENLTDAIRAIMTEEYLYVNSKIWRKFIV